MAAGDFSASVLLDIKLKAEEMWRDSRMSQELEAHAEAAQAVLQNQTARLAELQNSRKDRTVTVQWINPCPVETQDCESNCAIEGAELESDSQDYELDLCQKADFTVNIEKARTNAYEVEELAAIGMAKALKALDEWWAKQVLVKLKAFAGPNVAPAPWTYAAGTTTVPAAEYNLSMVANLEIQARLNRMGTPYYIDNGTLWLPVRNAQLNAGNLDGYGDLARARVMERFNYDFDNFAKAGLTEDTFMIARGAVAFITKNRYNPNPEEVRGKINQTRYSVPSPTLPGIRYDVIYEMTCITNPTTGRGEDVHAWRFETNGGIFLNPNGCPIDLGAGLVEPTGVLSYSKGA